MFYSPSVSFSFSTKFIEKSNGGCLERSLAFLDRVLAISSRCIRFIDVSDTGNVLIREELLLISSVEILAKVVIGILLLPLTIIALALRIILRMAFYCKETSSKEWVEVKAEEPKELLQPLSRKEYRSIVQRLGSQLSNGEVFILKELYQKIREKHSSGEKTLEELEKEFHIRFVSKKTMDPGECMSIEWPSKFPNRIIVFFVDSIPTLGCYAGELFLESKLKTYSMTLKEWKGKASERSVLVKAPILQTGDWTYQSLSSDKKERVQAVLENLNVRFSILS
ncbi:hypothetical protein [Chlamydiifrater volucris]|uniref:hypothetical protein n=1 Tax=Chlamydiifrater volucris TaxID=2681470 RepID=UPI001BCEBDE9|nr:hypothetical protein [Chlamydiifrater volucris]